MQLDQTLMLSPVLRTVSTAAEHDYHRILLLQFRELPTFASMIGKFIVRKDSAWNNVGSHIENPSISQLKFVNWLPEEYLGTCRRARVRIRRRYVEAGR
jgi:hypothetical protein